MMLAKKLASSNTLDGLKQLVAEFYSTTPTYISFIPENSYWRVRSGTMDVTPIVVRARGRFIFGVPKT